MEVYHATTTVGLDGEPILDNFPFKSGDVVEVTIRLISIAPKRVRKAGSAKGLIIISDDFDDPLEDFKEYME